MSSPLTSGIRRAAMQLVLPGILAMLTVSANAVAMTPTVPVPNGPGPLVDLLKWCWEHRDITRYRDLFTADFQFQSGTDALWNRDDELATVGKLFGPGNGTQPGATIVTLDFLGAPQPGSYLPPGKPWPWHQQVLAPIILDIQRTDGSHLHAAGLTLFYLVRGDYASIPTDMQDRGFKPDST